MNELVTFFEQYQKIIVSSIIALSVYFFFNFGLVLNESGISNFVCQNHLFVSYGGVRDCVMYFSDGYARLSQFVFVAIAVTGFGVIVARRQTYFKWLILNILWVIAGIVISTLGLRDIYGYQSSYINSFLMAVLVYFALFFVIFVYDSIKYRQQEVEGGNIKLFRFTELLLVLEMAAPFACFFTQQWISLLVSLALVIPVMLFTLSVYIVYFKLLKKDAYILAILFAILLGMVVWAIAMVFTNGWSMGGWW